MSERNKNLVGRFVLRATWGAALLGLLLVSCSSEPDIGQPVEVIIVPTQGPAATTIAPVTGVVASGTILESLTENADFALFVAGWSRAGRSEILQDGGPFTVFAPTNVAFSRLGTATAQLDAAELDSLLRHHVVAQSLLPDQLAAAGTLTTSAGAPVRIGRRGGNLAVDYATIAGDPIITGNGIIYPVDAVLLPPEPGPERSIWGQIQTDERLTSLALAMGGTDTMYLLRFSQEPDAFLAPINEAMANTALPADLESTSRADPRYDSLWAYHVVTANGWPIEENMAAADMVERGIVETPVHNPAQFGLLYTIEITESDGAIFANGARLVSADIEGTNGMLHLIDAVLISPALVEDH